MNSSRRKTLGAVLVATVALGAAWLARNGGRTERARQNQEKRRRRDLSRAVSTHRDEPRARSRAYQRQRAVQYARRHRRPALFLSTEAAAKVGLKPSKDDFWTKVGRLDFEGGPKLEDMKGRIEDIYQLVGMNALGLAGAKSTACSASRCSRGFESNTTSPRTA